jgi:predicted ArsR family transcriptional regulator
VTRKNAGLAALSSLDDPVRDRLYQFVSGRAEPVGRDEAALAAGIGRPLAAYHLDKLVELGLLKASYRRTTGRTGPGAGRPAKVYSRSGREFAATVPPREYELAADLLAVAVEADQAGGCRAALHDAAHEFGAKLGRRALAAENEQVTGSALISSALDEHGFESCRSADGTIVLRNCPFHQLATRHPEVVCGMSLALIEGLVAAIGPGGTGSGAYPMLDPKPGRCCVVITAATPAGESRGTGAP